MMRLTPIVKNLLIINVIVFGLQKLIPVLGVTEMFSLWKLGSVHFQPYQFLTYMFAHGSFFHIMFNMLGLVFLGPLLETFWGPKRFLTFYLVTGIGAALIYSSIEYYSVAKVKNQVETYLADPGPDQFNTLMSNTYGLNPQLYNFIDQYSRNPNDETLEKKSISLARELLDLKQNFGSMLGASGAIYGILMAFGLIFPNLELMLIFPPIPVKAKYLVLILGGIALYSGLQGNPGDNVAHFAHLGGMIFAYIMIRYWRSKGE
ncbi:MAG TPA: rhomboid family intramembrane serine protease [Cyclobacteriaceae bacterium]|nr:rhomboid family intramembrane serine protease [Cyclobacteriaceae bacterium]